MSESGSSQIALPLDWSAGGMNDGPLLVGPSNEDAVRYLHHVGSWPVRIAILVGPRGSGRTSMGRIFMRETGGKVIDGAASLSEENMFHAWNEAQSSGIPLLIIADKAPEDWNIQLPDLASRIASVPVLHIGEPDQALARDLIEALFAQRGMVISPEISAYIVPRMEQSYAAIHKIVAALDEALLETGRRLGIRLTRETLLSQGLIIPDLLERQDAILCR